MISTVFLWCFLCFFSLSLAQPLLLQGLVFNTFSKHLWLTRRQPDTWHFRPLRLLRSLDLTMSTPPRVCVGCLSSEKPPRVTLAESSSNSCQEAQEKNLKGLSTKSQDPALTGDCKTCHSNEPSTGWRVLEGHRMFLQAEGLGRTSSIVFSTFVNL